VRLFVAVDLPAFLRERLATLIATLRREVTGPRWVRVEGIHLTLKFLGEVAEADLPKLRDALTAVGEGSGRGFHVIVEGLGQFPERGRPRVLWIGLREQSGALAALQGRVEDAVSHAGLPGIKSEQRPFHPHLTLARWRDSRPSDRTRALAAEIHEPIAPLGIDSIALYQSRLSSAGSTYTVLARATLM
jgi:2'-5' RNA ligase